MNIKEQLEALLPQKKSNLYYAMKLGISEKEVISIKENIKNERVSTSYNHKKEEGEQVIVSDKPLSPKELEKLAKVDNISTFLERHWLKSKANGKWTYTIQVGTKIKDFYSDDEYINVLKDIFKSTKPFQRKAVKSKVDNKALFVYVSDDHAGLKLENSQYGNEYNSSIYVNRLTHLADEIIKLDNTFEVIYIVRLGDELDGWNGKTTRYDHDLDSLSNKQQFDIYTIANKIFYDTVLSSNKAKRFEIINLEDSNHSGKGYSYMANKALEFWIQARFPLTKITHQSKFIDHYQYGNHLIAMCHGKDERYMKAPMPLYLDLKTDLYLSEYFKPWVSYNYFLHLIKGDMHKYGINQGKFGRYVNVPSISSGSKWIELNYGDSKPGALLEIYNKDKEGVQSIPIWFK